MCDRDTVQCNALMHYSFHFCRKTASDSFHDYYSAVEGIVEFISYRRNTMNSQEENSWRTPTFRQNIVTKMYVPLLINEY